MAFPLVCTYTATHCVRRHVGSLASHVPSSSRSVQISFLAPAASQPHSAAAAAPPAPAAACAAAAAGDCSPSACKKDVLWGPQRLELGSQPQSGRMVHWRMRRRVLLGSVGFSLHAKPRGFSSGALEVSTSSEEGDRRQKEECHERDRERQRQRQEKFVSAAIDSSNSLVLKPPADTPGGLKRRQQIKEGHPWIFDFEIENIRLFTKTQTGELMHVYDNDGEYLGAGLFSRQAAVAVRMMTRSSSSSNSSSSSDSSSSNSSSSNSSSNSSSSLPQEVPIGSLLRSRFLDALQRRGFTINHQNSLNNNTTNNSSSSNNNSSSSSKSSNSSSKSSNSSSSDMARQSVWRAVDGEADGLPGVEVDVYGTAAVLRVHSQALAPHIPELVALVKETLQKETVCLQQLFSKKEKLAQGGAEYRSELLLGSDPEVWVDDLGVSGIRLPLNLFFPPFAAFATHAIPLVPMLRRFCTGGSMLTIDASVRGIGISCLRGLGCTDTCGDGENGEGAESLVMIETSEITNVLNEKAAAANGVEQSVSCIYTEDVGKELRAMKDSGLRFRAVYVHLHPKVRFVASERGGQFGRWFRPTFRGVQSQWNAAAALLEEGGLLMTSLLLPVCQSSWVFSCLSAAAETAGRRASLVYSSAASSNAKLLTVQTDLWREQVFCIQLR